MVASPLMSDREYVRSEESVSIEISEWTSFVGRDDEVQELRSALKRGVRLLTIFGPGGIGKTRLARRVGRLEEEARSGCIFIDLTSSRSAQDVHNAVLLALGAPLPACRQDTLDSVQLALTKCEGVLLILDNFEHVAEFAAQTIAKYLRASSSPQILVTSRETLRLSGEFLFKLSPLSLPETEAKLAILSSDAGKFFATRLLEAGYELKLGDETISKVYQILHDLDGIPLALELAAARVPTLGLSTVVDRLCNSLDLLVSDKRDANPRHLTLRTAIQWSWDQLDEAESKALRYLSTFAGRFSRQAASRVISPENAVIGVAGLDALRRKSLVCSMQTSTSEVFYLYSAVREFVLEVNPRQSVEEGHLRHFNYFWDRSCQLAGLDVGVMSLSCFADMSRDVNDYLQACRWGRQSTGCERRAFEIARALRVPILERGPISVLEELLTGSQSVDMPDEERLSIVLLQAELARVTGKLDACSDALDTANNFAIESRKAKSAILLETGELQSARSELSDAGETWEEALRLCDAAVPDLIQAEIRLRLGVLSADLGAIEEAEYQLEKAIAIFKRLSDIRGELHALFRLEYVHLRARRWDSVWRFHDQSLALAKVAGLKYTEGRIIVNAAIAAHCAGDINAAQELYQEAEVSLMCAGHRRTMALVEGMRGALALECGNLSESEHRLCASVDALRIAQDELSVAVFLLYRCHLETRRNRVALAEDIFSEVESIAAKYHDPKDPTLPGLLEIQEASIALAKARRFSELDQRRKCRSQLAIPVAVLQKPSREIGRALELSEDARIQLRLLREQFQQFETHEMDRADSILVEMSGAWFESGAIGRVVLEKRPVLRMVLSALASADNEQRALSADEIVELAWPDQKMLRDAGVVRVRTAISRLRKLGLGNCLVSTKDGYRLGGNAEVVSPR